MGNLNRMVAGYAAPTLVTGQRRILGFEKPADIEAGVTAVLSPASYGSFGDEGMIQGSRDSIVAASGKAQLFTPGPVEPWTAMGVTGVRSIDGIIALGRMHMDARKLRRLTRAERMVVLGADSIDGAYGIRSISQRVSLLNVAAAQGRRAELANFSFRRNPSSDALTALRRLDKRVRLTARDKNSQRRATEALQRAVGVFPDVAAYMKPGQSAVIDSLRAWVAGRDRPVVVLVPNAHLAAFDGTGYKEVARRFQAYMVALLDAGFAVVVLPHDVREKPGDIAMSEQLMVGMPHDDVMLAVPRNAQEAKGMLSLADVVVTARMHAGVAALSQGVPCVGLDYVDKFAGQFQWYGAEQFVVAWEDNPKPHLVAKLSRLALSQAGNAHPSTPDFVKAPPPWLR
ncbi:polysaccharide pyruvyl transferase family protein [Paenarthrobacter nitroguajacolicus]|uniref:Polysaccharide pyruvyl transferase family protein n=1 Tax=Paenarthrobacter nitroguajacolicus TaxID=211146 RepID=A0A558GZW3_PAENT|nr:polysaccharide pyruvyl transferase family protein [Paenarthrobacter nitroguajacolicus]TVU62382.1 polysaccharide pyruvyl transferase family protein [Paenarthrobacter nitroguajacolicus]